MKLTCFSPKFLVSEIFTDTLVITAFRLSQSFTLSHSTRYRHWKLKYTTTGHKRMITIEIVIIKWRATGHCKQSDYVHNGIGTVIGVNRHRVAVGEANTIRYKSNPKHNYWARQYARDTLSLILLQRYLIMILSSKDGNRPCRNFVTR